MAYWLELPFHGSVPVTADSLPEDIGTASAVPETIVDRRETVTKEGLMIEVLVEWCNQPREEATWESWSTLQQVFPSMDLEGKVVFKKGGIDKSKQRKAGVATEMEADLEESSTSTAQDESAILGRGKHVKNLPTWTGDYQVG